MISYISQKTQDRIIAICLTLYFFCFGLTGLFTSADGLTWLPPNYQSILSLLRAISIAIGLVTICISHKIKYLYIVLNCFVLLVFGISAIKSFTEPGLTLFLGETLNHFIGKFALALLLANIKNVNLVFKYLHKYSMIYFGCLIYILICLFFKNTLIWFTKTFVGDYMLFSFTMLPFVCSLLYHSVKYKNVQNKLIFGICFAVMMIWGCRGALVCVCGYAFLLFVRYHIITKKYLRLLFMSLSLFLLVITSFSYLHDFNNFLNDELGIKSYSINKLAKLRELNSKTLTSGRIDFYKKIICEMDDNYFFKGFNADRVLLNRSYAHNMFLEIIYNFGAILGSVVIITIITLLFYTIISKDCIQNDLLIFLGSIAIIKLMTSNTFMDESFLYLWLALFTTKFKLSKKLL